MTVQKLLDKVQTEKPNAFGNEKLLEYVNEIEATVAEQLHVTPEMYTSEDMGKTLLAPFPYDVLYESYVKAKIDYAHEEYASYQMNQEQFSADMEEFIDWIVRTNQVSINVAMPNKFRNVF